MTEPLSLEVRGGDAVSVVTVRGDLGWAGAGEVRSALLNLLVDQPGAIFVDLAGLTVSVPAALNVFTAVSRQAAVWPGIPLLFCSASPTVAELFDRGGLGPLPRYPTAAAARTALGTGLPPLLVADDLLPVAGAARHARDMVTEACARWTLPHLAAPASLIVSELVANVIDHAGSMMTVRVSLRSRQLHIAVRDGSPVQPDPGARPPTSGLGLVAALATGWGCLATDDGKVMWAVLAVDQGRPSSGPAVERDRP